MSPLIHVDELAKRLGDSDLHILDVRADLTDQHAGKAHYDAGHIPGSSFLSLDDDLASPVAQHGGRHPLPDMNAFADTLGARGITTDSSIVVYDEASGMFAARLWWLLRYAGCERVQVLDGGFSAWEQAGYKVSLDAPAFKPASFKPKLRPEMVVSMEDVRDKLEDPSVLIVDARAPERYRGDSEPLDPKAGHIPGAINKPFMDNLSGGCYKSAGALRERFEELEEADEVILYCGSGVSAAHNALALEIAGVEGAKLYVGSWSDWSSYDDNPVETGDNA